MTPFLLASLLVAGAGKPANDPGSWVQTSDYPKSEVARGITGVTSFTLIVNRTGTVDDCTVTSTSGSDALDATACALIRVRAHFVPAHDAEGHRVGFAYSSRVRWVLPGDEAIVMPTEKQVMTTAVDIDDKGIVTGCTILERPKGLSETAPTPCLNFPSGRKLRVLKGPSGKPTPVRMTIGESVSYEQK